MSALIRANPLQPWEIDATIAPQGRMVFTTTMPHTLEHFLALETQVWEALKAGDPDADRRMLTEDFLGVYETGFAGREEHAAMLKGGPTVERYALSDARLQVLAPDLVLLAYRALWVQPGGVTRTMFISSIWKRQHDGDWLNIFSQDTPASASG